MKRAYAILMLVFGLPAMGLVIFISDNAGGKDTSLWAAYCEAWNDWARLFWRWE